MSNWHLPDNRNGSIGGEESSLTHNMSEGLRNTIRDGSYDSLHGEKNAQDLQSFLSFEHGYFDGQNENQSSNSHHNHENQSLPDNIIDGDNDLMFTDRNQHHLLLHHHPNDSEQQTFSSFLQDLIANESSDCISSESRQPQYQHQNHQNEHLNGVVVPHEVLHSPVIDSINGHDLNFIHGSNSYTPLLSPSSTPIGPAHNGVIAPGTYFSPISSPAIEPQNMPFIPKLSNGDSDEFLVDGSESSISTRRSSAVSNSSGTSTRRSRTSTTPVLAAQARVTKSSPLIRPPRKKSSQTLQQQQRDNDSGSNDSISPQDQTSLQDIVMPPPQSTRKISTSSSSSTSPAISAAPVTPASLMSLAPRSSPKINSQQSHGTTEERLNEAIRATTAVSSRSSRSSTASRHSIRGSPQLSEARRLSISPMIKPKVSKTPNGSMNAKSPSISPRMTVSNPGSEDLSQVLASKSNYQNILEGRHNELGLQYPVQLSNDVTSKRTSHKIAEQGRRNRINRALSELAELISTDIPSNSKASTVENAIEYIKKLQNELKSLKEQVNKDASNSDNGEMIDGES